MYKREKKSDLKKQKHGRTCIFISKDFCLNVYFINSDKTKYCLLWIIKKKTALMGQKGAQMTPELLFESKTHFTDNDLSIKQ